jgi:hypothetical protein
MLVLNVEWLGMGQLNTESFQHYRMNQLDLCGTSGLAPFYAAALEPKAVAGLELHGALGSLKEVIEQNRSVDQMPELFCFGLLEATDVKHLAALVAPRPVTPVDPGPRGKAELSGLRAWYTTLGSDFNPLP